MRVFRIGSRMWTFVIVYISSLFISNHVYCQSVIPNMINALSEKFDEEFSIGAGGAAAIIHKGKVVYKKTFGREYANGPAISDDTYFAIGSVSKSVTALVFADLMAAKKLHLETALKRAIPNAPNGVEVQHLLSHSSGFIYKGNSQIERGRSRDFLLTELMRRGVGKQDFLYNNFAFSLLENIIEHETRERWANVFHQTLDKRGLGHLAVSTLPPDAAVAHPHSKRGDKLVSLGRLPRNYPHLVSSSAGVFASLNDLVKFAQVQFSPEFDFLHLPRIVANDIFHCTIPYPVSRDKIRSSYALGWRVMELAGDIDQSTRLVYHKGYLNGLSAFVGFMKTHDLAVVAVRNDDLQPPSKVGIDVWSAYLKSASLI